MDCPGEHDLALFPANGVPLRRGRLHCTSSDRNASHPFSPYSIGELGLILAMALATACFAGVDVASAQSPPHNGESHKSGPSWPPALFKSVGWTGNPVPFGDGEDRIGTWQNVADEQNSSMCNVVNFDHELRDLIHTLKYVIENNALLRPSFYNKISLSCTFEGAQVDDVYVNAQERHFFFRGPAVRSDRGTALGWAGDIDLKILPAAGSRSIAPDTIDGIIYSKMVIGVGPRLKVDANTILAKLGANYKISDRYITPQNAPFNMRYDAPMRAATHPLGNKIIEYSYTYSGVASTLGFWFGNDGSVVTAFIVQEGSK